MKKFCCLCGKPAGKKLANGPICKNCLRPLQGFLPKTKALSTYTVTDISRAIKRLEENKRLAQVFTVTRVAGRSYVEFDDEHLLFRINPHLISKIKSSEAPFIPVYKYTDMVSYELLENGMTVGKTGMGRAIAGGILLGGFGAVVGAITGKQSEDIVTQLEIKITMKDDFFRLVRIDMLGGHVKRGSAGYKNFMAAVHHFLAELDFAREKANVFLESQNSKQATACSPSSAGSVAEELKLFKELLDNGALTQEEFDQQKAKLLAR